MTVTAVAYDYAELHAEQRLREARRSAMLASCLPEQRRAIEDPSRLKALFCTRRAGKSYCIGVYLFIEALEHPQSSCLYLGLTRDTATAIMNKDIFRMVNERFRIGARWKASASRWELPNGSYIYMRGADANSYEMRKIVGQKYRLAILDEASKYRQNVHELVHEALLPAMGDDLGTVVLSGTPSNITTGLFFDVTTGRERGWTVHTWTWRENRFKVSNIQQSHDDMIAKNPALVGTPIYRQEWLGEWVTDLSALVYHYREDRNTIAALPKQAKPYSYILGVDLGYSDPTALVVGAYHDHDPVLYLVYAVKKSGLIISDVATMIRGLWHFPDMKCLGPYPFERMVVDAADLQGVEEMRQKHHLPLTAAKKAGKRGVIEAFNSDLATSRIKVLPAAMGIVDEWSKLIWDEKKLRAIPARWEEDPRFENHYSDSATYLWRSSRNFDAVDAPAQKPNPITDGDAWAEAEFNRMLDERRNVQAAGWPGNIRVNQVPAYARRQGR